MFALSTTGTAQLGMNSAGVLTWGSSTTVLNAATMNADTALCKNAPGVVRWVTELPATRTGD